jgi:hypothetical protein
VRWRKTIATQRGAYTTWFAPAGKPDQLRCWLTGPDWRFGPIGGTGCSTRARNILITAFDGCDSSAGAFSILNRKKRASRVAPGPSCQTGLDSVTSNFMEPCSRCGASTALFYGGAPLCLDCESERRPEQAKAKRETPAAPSRTPTARDTSVTAHYRRILKYWQTSNNPQPQELDVTERRLRLDGPVVELLNNEGTVERSFGPGQHPFDCWLVEVRRRVEEG